MDKETAFRTTGDDWRADSLWEIQNSQSQFIRMALNESMYNCVHQVLGISRLMYVYGTVVLLAIAVLLNGVMLLVFMSKSLRSYACSVYITALALLDMATLSLYLPRGWIHILITTLRWDTGYIGYNSNVIMCKTLTFLAGYFKFVSCWCLAALGYSRIVALKKNTRMIDQQTARSARLIIVYIACLGLLLNGHLLFTWSVLPNPETGDGTVCGPAINSTHVSLLLSIGTISANTGCPTIICFLLSIYLIKGLHKERHMLRRRLTNKVMSRLMKGRRMSQMVLALCGAFTLLSLPHCICWVVVVLQHVTMDTFSCSYLYAYAARDITEVISLLMYTCKLCICMMSGMSVISPRS